MRELSRKIEEWNLERAREAVNRMSLLNQAAQSEETDDSD